MSLLWLSRRFYRHLLAVLLVSCARAVTITDADHEGRAQFKIATAQATHA